MIYCSRINETKKKEGRKVDNYQITITTNLKEKHKIFSTPELSTYSAMGNEQ